MSDQPKNNDPLTALQQLTDPSVQGKMQSDAELLTVFVESGSRQAIETLIQRYAGMVASVCRGALSDAASAEDAFQATFLVLLKSAKKVKNRRSIGAWLHGVAYRTASRLRKRRMLIVSDESPDEVIAFNHVAPDPIVTLARKLELEALDQELEKLPQGLREILVEHYLLGYSAPQIARRTELSVSAIEGRLRRGRYALLRQLAKRGISLTVLVVASGWFHKHLQAAEADDWATTFLDSHLPEGASVPDFTSNSDISSLVSGETNMFAGAMMKGAISIGATILVGGLISFSVYGDGGKPSSDYQPDTATTVETIEQIASPVVAQFGGFGSSASAGVPQQTPAKALTETNEASVAKVERTQPAGSVGGSMGGMAGGMSMGGASAAPAKSQEAKKEPPILWQVPAGDSPAWLQSQDEADVEQYYEVRRSLKNVIKVDFQNLPIHQAVEEIQATTGQEIHLDTDALSTIGVDPDAPITIAGEMPLREFLRRALKSIAGGGADGQVTYKIIEKSIVITSQDEVDLNPTIRYYDLAYVLPNSAAVTDVVLAIEQTVAPDRWISAGGSSTISQVGSMLIIACDEPSHQQIEVMLTRIGKINKAHLEKGTPHPAGSQGAGMGGGGFF